VSLLSSGLFASFWGDAKMKGPAALAQGQLGYTIEGNKTSLKIDGSGNRFSVSIHSSKLGK